MGNKGGSSSGGTQVVQPNRPDIPNENLLQSSGLWRLLASSPYYSSPWRTMDFAQNYHAPTVQLPTFTNPNRPQPWGINATNPAGFTGGFAPSGGTAPPAQSGGKSLPGGGGKGVPNPQPAAPPQQDPSQAIQPLPGENLGGAGPRQDKGQVGVAA